MAKVNYLDKGISSMQQVINAQNVAATTAATGITMVEEKCLGFINLRMAEGDADAAKAAGKVLGLELPSINLTASKGDTTVLCFSPNEWLVCVANGQEINLTGSLQKALANYHSLVADVTGGTTKLNVTGDNTQDMLEKGTYVDLHDNIFKPGQFYGTQIAHAPAVIVKNGTNDFSLIIRRSFSDHIAHWAIDAAAEYGYTFV